MKLIDTNEMFREERNLRQERNDCVVRAVAAAFDLSYKDAHWHCAKHYNRNHRKGVRTLKEFDGKDELSSQVTPYVFNKSHLRQCVLDSKVDCIGNKDVGKTGLYLKKFLAKCDQDAAYIILSSGHTYCVKKGVVYGNPKDERTYVKLAYKIGG